MKLMWILLGVFFIVHRNSLCAAQKQESVCDPAQEGTSHKITCVLYSEKDMFYDRYRFHITRLHSVVDWLVALNETYETSTRCNDGGTPCSIDNVIRMKDWDSSLISELTITNVSRVYPFNMSTTWSCRSNDYGIYETVCKPLEIYAQASVPKCSSPSVVSKTVSMSCDIEKVYPEAGCEFLISTDNKTFTLLDGNILYNKTEYGTPVYYRSKCTLSATKMDICQCKTVYIKVRAYPKLKHDQRFYVDSQVQEFSYSTEVYQMSRTEQNVQHGTQTSGMVTGLGVGFALAILAVVALAVAAILLVRKNKNTLAVDTAMKFSHDVPPRQEFTTVNACLTVNDHEYEPVSFNESRAQTQRPNTVHNYEAFTGEANAPGKEDKLYANS